MQDTSSHYESVSSDLKVSAYVCDDRQDTIAVKRTAFCYMDAVLHGWCSYEKASILIDLILATKPKVALEIGVWAGRSLIPMACALKQNGDGIIYGIDPWNLHESVQGIFHENNKTFWELADHDEAFQKLQENINAFGLNDHIVLVRSTSLEAPLIEEIDLLHIDGNHSDETSYIDVTKWVPQVKSGGWIIFDDINWPDNGLQTNQRAVDYLNRHCRKFGEFTDISVWGIWVKP